MEASKIARVVSDRRSATYEFEPRAYSRPARSHKRGGYRATGITVSEVIEHWHDDGSRTRRTVRLNGRSLKKDGTISQASGADYEPLLRVTEDWQRDDLGLAYEVDEKHFPEIRALAEEALADFDSIDWEAQ